MTANRSASFSICPRIRWTLNDTPACRSTTSRSSATISS